MVMMQQITARGGAYHLDQSKRSILVLRTRTTYSDRRFAVAGPRVWNSLPTELRQSDSLGQFKRRLKDPFIWVMGPQRRLVTFVISALEVFLLT